MKEFFWFVRPIAIVVFGTLAVFTTLLWFFFPGENVINGAAGNAFVAMLLLLAREPKTDV